jgi:hypothetical protein
MSMESYHVSASYLLLTKNQAAPSRLFFTTGKFSRFCSCVNTFCFVPLRLVIAQIAR